MDGAHSNALTLLNNQLSRVYLNIHNNPVSHMIWCGDFNRHHPNWDAPSNHHLFMPAALEEAGVLLDMVDRFNMVMALP